MFTSQSAVANIGVLCLCAFRQLCVQFYMMKTEHPGRPEKRGIHAFGIRPMAANINPGQFSTPSSLAHSDGRIRFVWFAIALEFNAHPVGVDRRS